MKTRYKFLRTNLKSDNGKDRDWKIGAWRKEDKIDICNLGFHCSKTPLQALSYVRGEIIAKVEVKGNEIINDDKECYSEMRIVKAWHWKKEDSISLAIFSAELVIDIFEKKYPNDKLPREAINAAKNYLKALKTGDKEKIKNASAAAYAANSAYYAANAANAAYYAYYAAYYAADAADAANAAYYAANAAYYARKEIVSKIDAWFENRIKKLEKYA